MGGLLWLSGTEDASAVIGRIRNEGGGATGEKSEVKPAKTKRLEYSPKQPTDPDDRDVEFIEY